MSWKAVFLGLGGTLLYPSRGEDAAEYVVSNLASTYDASDKLVGGRAP